MLDVDLASTMIANESHPDASVIWGVAFDPELEDEMRITIIATGFEKKPEDNVMAERRLAARGEKRASMAPSYAHSPITPTVVEESVVVEEEPVVESVAEQQVETETSFDDNNDDDGNAISKNDFEEIMAILRKSKNRNNRN